MNPLKAGLDLHAELPEEQRELLQALDHVVLRRSEWAVLGEARQASAVAAADRHDSRDVARPKRPLMITLGL